MQLQVKIFFLILTPDQTSRSLMINSSKGLMGRPLKKVKLICKKHSIPRLSIEINIFKQDKYVQNM